MYSIFHGADRGRESENESENEREKGNVQLARGQQTDGCVRDVDPQGGCKEGGGESKC